MLWALSESSALPPGELSNMNQQKSSTYVELQIGAESTSVPTSQSSPNIQNGTIFSLPPVIPHYSITKDRTRKDIRPPQKNTEVDLVAYALNVAEGINSGEEPSSYSEVVTCDDSDRWMIAMKEEMELLLKNGTWDLSKKFKTSTTKGSLSLSSSICIWGGDGYLSESQSDELTQSVVLIDSQYNVVRLVHTLMACEEVIQQEEMKLAEAFLKQIAFLAVSQAGAMRK
ncbi:uncharacterized protein LOC124895179, partial [Capsicum annuum]|uniref:uncharacterized protein LOC124895179 n=1 Tax=Capsicum annuum TaxID=4072 RepID=UPI001FB05BAB